MKNSCKNFAKSFAKLLPALAAIVGPNMGVAQQVEPCSSDLFPLQAAMSVIQDQRSFAQGAVKLFLLDLGQPEAGSFFLLVFSPPLNEMGDPQRRVISYSGSIGLYGLTFGGLQAQYDPAVGLGFAIPGAEYLPEDETTGYRPIYLLFTVNQQTGDIQANIEGVGG